VLGPEYKTINLLSRNIQSSREARQLNHVERSVMIDRNTGNFTQSEG
jgi:hypothetical protein